MLPKGTKLDLQDLVEAIRAEPWLSHHPPGRLWRAVFHGAAAGDRHHQRPAAGYVVGGGDHHHHPAVDHLLCLGWWDTILGPDLLDIRINACGYFCCLLVLFSIWLVTLLFFDGPMYMVFTPGQLKVCTEIGGGEKVFDTMGLNLEKQQRPVPALGAGLGSGDIVLKTAGARSASHRLTQRPVHRQEGQDDRADAAR